MRVLRQTLPVLYRRLSNVLADFRCICPFCSSCLHRSVLSEGMLLGIVWVSILLELNQNLVFFTASGSREETGTC